MGKQNFDDDVSGEALMSEILEGLDLDDERELRTILRREKITHDYE